MRGFVMPWIVLAVFVGIVAGRPAVAGAAAPSSITFTARLTDGGVAVGGTHNFGFTLYDAPAAGNKVWQETQNGVVVTGGLVAVQLGKADPFGDIFGEALWLEIELDGSMLAGRVELGAVPYAHNAGFATIANGLTQSALAGVITNVVAGAGAAIVKAGTVVTVSVQFAGTGVAQTAARSDHHHDAAYLKKGATLACAGTNKVTGFDAVTGNVICGVDAGGTTYTGGLGITVTGADVAIDPTEAQRRVSGACMGGAIAKVNEDGTVTCTDVPGATLAGGLVADGAGDLGLAAGQVTTRHTLLPMGQGNTAASLTMVSGSNNALVVFNQVGQGTRCHVTALAIISPAGANATGQAFLRPIVRDNTTGTTTNIEVGNAPTAYTTATGQQVYLTKSSIVTLVDDHLYDFGCRITASGDWIGDSLNCEVTYHCQ